MKRFVSACSPDHECSDEEINGIIRESNAVMEDSSIVEYEFPTVEEMKHILLVSETFTGEWYHSRVTVEQGRFVSEEHQKLMQQIVDLPDEAGVFKTFYVQTSKEIENKLIAAFASAGQVLPS